MVQYFAQASIGELSTVLGVVFGGFGALLVGFYKYAQWSAKEASKERRDERTDFTKALNRVADSNAEIAKQTAEMKTIHEQGYKEAKERNGHLAEITIEARDSVLHAINKIGQQDVKEQIVEHQTIKNRE